MSQRSSTRNAERGTRDLIRPLLRWFSRHARDLPWRRRRDPYAVWISEIMLQQTQVKTVVPYWKRWMRELPDVRSLASAPDQRVLKLWEGLGYYSRVRNAQRAAAQIVDRHGGEFPRRFEDVLALPGVGRYTAGAISSIAFDEPRPILDGNVIRVLTRLFGIGGDPHGKKTNARLWRLAEELVTRAGSSRCSAFNQALMELGALVCTPRAPRCGACPLRRNCNASRTGRAGELPRLARRAVVTERRVIAFVVERKGKFLVRQRLGGVVNAQLWEFPNIEAPLVDGATPGELLREHLGLRVRALQPLGRINHSITRYRIRLEAYRVVPSRRDARLLGRDCWLSLAELDALPFTSAHRKVLEMLGRGATTHAESLPRSFAAESARGPAQSRTLREKGSAPSARQRSGLRQPSAAFSQASHRQDASL